MKVCLRCFLASLLLCLSASVSFAGVITGTITNGTTGKPAADVQIILFKLQGGMQAAATTKTDASGHYRIESDALGNGPMLLRAIYHGVNYHEPVTPNKTSIDIQVFEPTDKAGAFAVTAHAIILQPTGAELTVGEEYNIQNSTQPPMAFFRADGSFIFGLPQGAQLNDVSAVGSSGMPVKQAAVDKGKDEHAIAFPFRPGSSGVRIAYHLPYENDRATLRFASPYAAERLAIFAPPTMTVTGEGFAPAGQDQGFNVYLRESVAANTPVTVSISGTAPPLAPDSGSNGAGAGAGAAAGGGGDDSQNPAVNSRAESGATAATGSFTAMPARLDSLQWILVAGFGVLFVLGAIFLWRQPVGSLAAAAAGTPAVASVAPPAKTIAPRPVEPLASAAVPQAGAAVANLEQQIRGGLDELKDMLFRLELRREAGTISAEDYARDRERVQKVLRDLVKG